MRGWFGECMMERQSRIKYVCANEIFKNLVQRESQIRDKYGNVVITGTCRHNN